MASSFLGRADLGAATAASAAIAIVTMLFVIWLPSPAISLELETAIEQCRASRGRPIYQPCRQSGQSHDACIAKSKPVVQACVKAAMLAARPKAKLFDADKVAAPAGAAGKAIDVAADSQTAALVAPPRKVSDITAILDQQKPDAEAIEKLNAAANTEPPKSLKGNELGDFYYKRAQARASLGRNAEALTDGDQALVYGKGDDYKNVVSRYEQFVMRRLRDAGELKRAEAMSQKQNAFFEKQAKGRLFSLNLTRIAGLVRKGDITAAEAYVGRSRALLTEAQRWTVFPTYGLTWQAVVEDGIARVAEARGRYADAEVAYGKATRFHTASLSTLSQWESKPADGEIERSADWTLALQGRVKVKQGRVGEGEADVRRALLNRLKGNGKYHIDTAGILSVLVYVMQEQGRFDEAEQLQERVIDIYKGLGYQTDSNPLAFAHSFLAQIYNLQRRYSDAGKLYDQIDAWTVNWEPSRREIVGGGLARVGVMLSQGDIDNAAEIAKRSYDRERVRSGDKSFNTAVALGFYASALARKTDRIEESLKAFREAIPILLTVSGGSDDDSGSTAAARESRVRFVVEGYLRLLAVQPAIAPPSANEETFGYADVLRGQSVQRALQASSARSAVGNPQLASLVRASQDGEKQIGATVALLNNLLTLPAGERDDNAVKVAQAQIAKLQAARTQALSDIARKFPDYGNLTNPPPPNATDIQKHLTSDEAVLSFYFGRFDSFVWVVRKNGPVKFARIRMTLGDLNAKVTKLREALEPKAAMISDIPPFDLALASELYGTLLKPLEADWMTAKNLIVVTNGALGLLPLSLLPTAPAEVKADEDPLFVGYRGVPWLARTHAVTLVPSSSALQTLRKLPPGKPARQQFIAFGDPYFNQEQATDADKLDKALETIDPAATRGIPLKRRNAPQLDGVDSAQLGLLPRLPDTSDELKSIAIALQADPTKVLNLGKDASESRVKTADLSGFKIVAFATHGLVPGELDGLTQPALALSSPSVSGGEGDGLLTMEEILSLKLDADWVVLSACNTGAGAGAGAEAASGLGRAFFYAGTRALLVTNWSVHSQSARELVTDLFKRQADDPRLTRGEALRQAMMALVDGPGYVGADSKTEFAYAHPMFWAPYSIIGDGGGR